MARNGGADTEGTASQALRRMAEAEPELAARMMVQSMPVAAATLPDGLSYRLELSARRLADCPQRGPRRRHRGGAGRRA